MSIKKQFVGLPIEDLICAPLIGMAKGQKALNDVTWEYISEVAFEDAGKKTIGEKEVDMKSTRHLDIELNRYISDNEGNLTLQQITSKLPMLPLVPLPSLAITQADIEFTMEVKQSAESKASVDATVSSQAKVSGGFFGAKYSASISGSVSTHRENTRKTDNAAKYNVKVHAEQLPPTEGMSKLNDMLQMMIEPVIVNSGGDNKTIEENTGETE